MGQVPNNEEEEDAMDAIPLLAATAAMQAEPTEEVANEDNYQTIDIDEQNEDKIKTFDHYEKSFRDVSYHDDNDDNDDNNQQQNLLSKAVTGAEAGQDENNYHSDTSNFIDEEGHILVDSTNDNNDSIQKDKDSSKAAGFWFNIVSFIILVVVSGITIAIVLVLIPGGSTEEEPKPPITIPVSLPKHIIEGSCIKGQSISMSSNGDKIIYVNSDYDLNNNNELIFNTSIVVNDIVTNEFEDISTMDNIASALIDYMPVTISADGNTLAYTSYSIKNFTTVQIYQIDDKSNNWTPFASIVQPMVLPGGSMISLSLSNNGNCIAIGHPKAISASGIESGRADLYMYNDTSTKWEFHEELFGYSPGDMTGYSVAVSYDKTNATNNNDTLVFSAGVPGDDNGIGSVTSISNKRDENLPHDDRILKDEIKGIGDNGLFGTSISLSDDGRRMAIGSSHYKNTMNNANINNGKCDVYEKKSHDDATWVKVGYSIIGDINNGYLGYNVALSGDGNRVAISSKNPYIVHVYEYTSENWGMIPNTNFTYPKNNNANITINDDSIIYGSSISLNYDGSILAISTEGGSSSTERITNSDNSTIKCGKILIYDVNKTNSDTS